MDLCAIDWNALAAMIAAASTLATAVIAYLGYRLAVQWQRKLLGKAGFDQALSMLELLEATRLHVVRAERIIQGALESDPMEGLPDEQIALAELAEHNRRLDREIRRSRILWRDQLPEDWHASGCVARHRNLLEACARWVLDGTSTGQPAQDWRLARAS